ncbi:MAG TPA: hypothetical protein VM577_14975 [Anaerovoracaceae bacterium]|nr:hypothetical protein [Anaerovoracaceae bacterium]
MATYNPPRRRSAAGFSLVSLMVGMALGLVIIATLMSVYNTTVNFSKSMNEREATRAAVNDSLMAIHNQVAQAGYGSGASIAASLVLISGASIDANGVLSGTAQTTPTSSSSSSVGGNAAVWSWVEPGSSQTTCQGFAFIGGQLIKLLSTTCSSASGSWSSLQWQTSSMVSSGLSNSSTINLSYANCNSLVSGSTAMPMMTISPAYSDGSTNIIKSTICMQNL